MPKTSKPTITAEQFAKMSPHARGYAAYMFGADSEQPNVPDENNPYPEGSTSHELWNKGQRSAVLAAVGA